MSMSFKNDLTEENKSMIKELLGDNLAALDNRQALFNNRFIKQQDMKKVANETGQVVEVELNDDGDIKTMADGTRYQVTPQGWKKLA